MRAVALQPTLVLYAEWVFENMMLGYASQAHFAQNPLLADANYKLKIICQMIHKDDIKWKMEGHMALRNQYHAQYSDKELGVTMEVITNRTDGGYGIGKAKSFYFIDKDEREFLSAEDLVNAYNEKFQFSEENPEHEMSYFKVIKKRSAAKGIS